MADGGVLTSKNSDKGKLIQRTTSETLRLTDPEKGSLSSSTPRKKTSFQITSVTVVSRSSNDGGEDSADDLDESHTEDISEIIENSRVTDLENETPSYSEDTFSKDDVFFNASSSLVSAPVIPTSSQYGLAILANHENSDPSNLDVSDSSANSEIRVEVNESSVVNLEVVSTKHDPEMRDMIPPAPRTERFKVVKIESTEPFKRGRWQCMDYLDAQNPKSENTDSNNIETNNINSVVNINNNNNNNHLVEDHQPNSEIIVNSNMQTDNQQVNNQQIPINPPSNIPPAYTSVSPGQSLQNNMQMQGIINSAPQPQVTQQSQSLSQVHMQQILANTNQHQSLQPQQIQQVLANVMPLQQQQQQQSQQSQQTAQTTQSPQQQQPQQAPQPSQPSSQSQNIQQQPLIQSQPQQPLQQMQPPIQYQQAQQQPIQPQQQSIQQQYSQPIQQQQQQQPQQMLQQQVPQQTIQQPIQPVHMQQMPIQQQSQGMMPQMQQMPQQVVQGSYSQSIPIPQQTVVTQTSSQPMMQPIHPQMQNYQQPMMTNIPPQPIMNIQSQPHLQPQYYQNASMPQQTTPLITSQGGMLPPMSQNNVSMQSTSMPPLQTFSSLSQQMQVPSMPQTPPVQTTVQYSLPMSMAQQPLQQMSQTLSNMPIQQQQQPQQQQQQPQSYSHSSQSSQSFSQVSSLPTSSVDLGNMINAEHASIPAPTAALLESLQEVTASPEEVTAGDDPESLRGLARALATAALDLPQPSASGASAVAIDNKIEQAMDLVKSHLMFAVREEVEVLKEKIAELMERIAQLESENNVLRAGASPETLAQLPPPQPPLSSNPT